VLICCEKKVLLADWWLILIWCERKTLLDADWLGDKTAEQSELAALMAAH